MGLRSFSRYRHLLWIAALVLVAGGTLLLAACGSKSSTNASTSTPTPTATQQQASTLTPTSTPTPTPTQAPAKPGGDKTFHVSIVATGESFAFSPATLTIPKGSTVIWTNNSPAPHTVTGDTMGFAGSETLSQSQTFQMVFTTAGTYTYHCDIHPDMTASIIVTA